MQNNNHLHHSPVRVNHCASPDCRHDLLLFLCSQHGPTATLTASYAHAHSTVLILSGSVHNNGVSATRHRIRWIPLAFLTMAMSLSLGVPLALNEGVYNSHL